MSAKRSGRKEGRGTGGRRNDRSGSMPFSLVAVLLLVLSSISVVVLYAYDDSHHNAHLPAETISEMKVAAAAACEDVQRSAYSAALEAIRETRDLDEGSLSQRFQVAFQDALNASYPDDSGRFRIAVQQNNVTLTFLRASLEDAYVVYGRDEAAEGRVSLPAFFALSGSFVLNVSGQHGRILWGQDVRQDIYLPLPFFFDRLARLGASAAPLGDLEGMVRYMLSALAQERVLFGYGMSAQTGPQSTADILIDQDVVRAVNLAVVLEQLRTLRSASGPALAQFPQLEYLLDGDLPGEGVDPADLFLSTYGDGEIDLAPLVSQAIRAYMDRMLISWLDYYHIIELENFNEDVIEGVIWGLRDITDLLTGGDSDQEDIVKYVSQVMDEAGYRDSWYRWFNYGSGNGWVDLPAFEFCFYDDNGNPFFKTFQGVRAVDFPDLDVFASPAWGEFYHQYISNTHELVRQLKSFISTVADLVAAHCTLDPVDLALDPADGTGLLDEVSSQISRAFLENPDWLRPALDQAQAVNKVRDDLAQAVMNFLDRQWQEILDMNGSIDYAIDTLSKDLVKELDGTPYFSEASQQDAQRSIRAVITGGDWALQEIKDAFNERAQGQLEEYYDALSRKNDSLSDNVIVQALAWGVSNLPGMETVVTSGMLKMVQDMNSAAQMWGGEMEVPVGTEGFQLVSRNGLERTEHLLVSSQPLQLSPDGATGLAVEITQPWDYSRDDSAYPNRHVTDLGNHTFSPYLTQWEVSYEGSVQVTLRVAPGAFDGAALADIPCTVDIPLSGCFAVVTSSAWGLQGVDYRPTATLASDIVDFLAKAWDFLVAGAQALAGTAYQAFSIFAQLVSMALTAAVKPLEILSDLLTAGADALEGLISGSLSTVLGAIADVTQAVMGGTTVRLSLLGLSASLVIAPRDSALAGTEDMIRLDTSFSLSGTTVASSLRVLRLADGSHTILGNVEMSQDDWRMDLIVDPLTKVYQHQVEAKGYIGDKAIDLVLPEIVRTQKVKVELSDIPGLGALLKLIPSPVPGVKFHIDGGIEVYFNLLSKNTLMINEFEQNPAGEDRDRERAELFNPTDQAVDLSGWSLVTSHGDTYTEVLGHVIVPAHGYYVHTFSGQALDNGGAEGFPLQESLALLDPSGLRVDAAPWTKDLANDGRTWQRAYDGSSTWEFREGTLGRSNGGVLYRDLQPSDIASLLTGSFQDAFGQLTCTAPDAQTVEELFRSALGGLQERILDAVGNAVSEVEIFLELGLDDYSGSLGAGVGLALVADGKGVRACFGWAADAVGELLVDPLNPLAAVARAPVPMDDLGEHMAIQLKAFVRVGLPDMVRSVNVETEVEGALRVQWSLGTLGIGSGGGTVRFGLVIEDLPGPRLRSGAFTAADCVDVWLLRGTISPA